MKFFFILALIALSPHLFASEYVIDSSFYKSHAKQWIQNFMGTDSTTLIPHEDFQSLANILYFSYYRSKITLDAQHSCLEALKSIWHGYDNICATRLNPSKTIPHDIDVHAQHALLHRYEHQVYQHRTIGKMYASLIEAGVHSNLLKAARSVKALDALRHDARVVVAGALLDVRTLLGELYYTARAATDNLAEKLNQTEECVRRGIGIMDFIYSYIPQLAVKSFVEADDFNRNVSNEGWQTLMAIQEVSYKTWLMIEQARASFYKAHYEALYEEMKRLQIPDSYFSIIIENEETLSPENNLLLLPKPDQLP